MQDKDLEAFRTRADSQPHHLLSDPEQPTPAEPGGGGRFTMERRQALLKASDPREHAKMGHTEVTQREVHVTAQVVFTPQLLETIRQKRLWDILHGKGFGLFKTVNVRRNKKPGILFYIKRLKRGTCGSVG